MLVQKMQTLKKISYIFLTTSSISLPSEGYGMFFGEDINNFDDCHPKSGWTSIPKLSKAIEEKLEGPKVKLQSWPPEIIDDYVSTQHIQQFNDNEEENFGFTLMPKDICAGLQQSDLNLKDLTDKNVSPPSMTNLNEELYLNPSYSLDNTFFVTRASISDVFNSEIFDINSSVVMISRDIVNGGRKISHPSDEAQASQKLVVFQVNAAADLEIYNTSWRKLLKDVASHSAKYVRKKAWENADYYGRLIITWHINHLAVDALSELTANISCGVANLAGGPAVGVGAYYTTKGVLKTLRFLLPGFEGYLAGVYVPLTKTLIVDPLLNYGPSVAKGVAKAVYSVHEFIRGGSQDSDKLGDDLKFGGIRKTQRMITNIYVFGQ